MRLKYLYKKFKKAFGPLHILVLELNNEEKLKMLINDTLNMWISPCST